MKDVVEALIKRYFDIRMIAKRTIINERRGRVTISVYDDVAPNLWGMYKRETINTNTGLGELDFNEVERIQEQERLRIARQILEFTITILKDQSIEGVNKKKEWDAKYGQIAPEVKGSNHVEIVKYSLGALFHLGILTPYEYDIMEPALDESRRMLYVKNIPKPKTDDLTEALGYLTPQELKT